MICIFYSVLFYYLENGTCISIWETHKGNHKETSIKLWLHDGYYDGTIYGLKDGINIL